MLRTEHTKNLSPHGPLLMQPGGRKSPSPIISLLLFMAAGLSLNKGGGGGLKWHNDANLAKFIQGLCNITRLWSCILGYWTSHKSINRRDRTHFTLLTQRHYFYDDCCNHFSKHLCREGKYETHLMQIKITSGKFVGLSLSFARKTRQSGKMYCSSHFYSFTSVMHNIGICYLNIKSVTVKRVKTNHYRHLHIYSTVVIYLQF